MGYKTAGRVSDIFQYATAGLLLALIVFQRITGISRAWMFVPIFICAILAIIIKVIFYRCPGCRRMLPYFKDLPECGVKCSEELDK
jgi:hypothetical protein